MAMIKCKECETTVSSKAATCPNCGAPKPKKTSRAAWLAVGLLALLVVGSFGNSGSTASKPRESTAAAAAAPPPAPAAVATQSQEQKDEKVRVFMAVTVADLVRQSLREPDSLKWEHVRVSDKADVVCMSYRSRNGFGGMNYEQLAMINGKLTDAAGPWNKHCTQPMRDYVKEI